MLVPRRCARCGRWSDMAILTLMLVVVVIGSYAWGVAMGYGWGRVMDALDRRELEKYRSFWPPTDEELRGP